MKTKLAISLISSFLCLPLAHATPANEINKDGSLLEMCATAQEQVPHDISQASILIKKELKNRVEAANSVNANMRQFSNEIKKNWPAVEIVDQNYSTQEETGKFGSRWDVSQWLTLESKNTEQLEKAVAYAQGFGGTVNSFSTRLSDKTRKVVEQRLYEKAFSDVLVKIDAMSKAFGQSSSNWRVAHMNTMPNNQCMGFQGGYGMASAAAPDMMRMQKDEAAVQQIQAPVLIQGKDLINVTFWVAAKSK